MRSLGVTSLRSFVTSVLLIFATEGVGVQVQEFRVRPEDVQVRAGDDVFLRCIVGNQQGKAQWTKDGFALGFERSVPGYPRYEYAGEAALGEHHLVVRGVTLEDDGEYQCQVGPTAASLPIWAAANVTVMVAPRSIAVVGRQDKEVVEIGAGSPLQLKCLVSDGRPAPTVVWYRDDLRLDPALQTDTVLPSRTPRLSSALSVLSLEAVRSQEDGDVFSCRAEHPAILLQEAASYGSSSGRKQGRPLRVSVALSVLHPPGPPVISGYQAGEVLQAGERRTLRCRVEGGNPRPWVTWYWHGRGERGKGVYLKGKATIRRGKGAREVSLEHQVTASRAVDGAVYECRVSSDRLRRPLSAEVVLTVHYAPVQVKVGGPSAAPAGENLTLTCLTSPANPPAALVWSLDAGLRVNATRESVSRAEGGGWLTSSELTLRAPRSGGVTALEVTCRAYHLEHKEPIEQTREVAIIRLPGRPSLEVTPRGRVMADTDLQVTCESEGGHPTPQFRLFKGGKEMPMPFETATKGNLTKARFAFRATPADNGAPIRCEVTNAASPTPLAALTPLELLYPAWGLEGWVSPESVHEGHLAKLTCETSSSVPPSTVSWDASKDVLGEPSVTHSPGLYGGTVTRSEVELRLLAEDDGEVVTCSASNGLGQVISANVSLNVLHGPVWVEKPRERIDVLEGQDLTLRASAVANPGPVRYRWRRNGSREVEEEGSSTGVLHLGPARRQQTGNYSVEAEGGGGAVASAFFLNVLYGPEDVLTETEVVVEENGAAALLCSASGNPTPNVTWTRRAAGTSGATRVLSAGVGVARLSLLRASRADAGVYLCRASSGASAAAPSSSSTLVVNQSPWWTGRGPEGGPWAAVGGRGRLDCRVRAAPPPTFHWASRDGREIKSGGKYSIQSPKLVDEVVEWSSVLEIGGVTPPDYSTYTCTAVNALGKHSHALVLRPPIPPATPMDLTVANVTSNEAVLFWTPNLSQTEPTGYVVRFWSIDEEYQYMNVSGKRGTEVMVSGLRSGTPYTFTIQAYSPQGRSHHTSPVHAITLDVPGSASSSSSSSDGGAKWQVPRLLLLVTAVAGMALLALNIAIIACFVRRRNSQSIRGVSASSSKTTTLEALTPATTPGDAARGEDLPLTAAAGGLLKLPPAGGSLLLLPPPQKEEKKRRRRRRRKHREEGDGDDDDDDDDDDDGCCYSYYYYYCYSPIPQEGGANPPDVCPADDPSGSLPRRTRRRRKGQRPQQEEEEAPRGGEEGQEDGTDHPAPPPPPPPAEDVGQ